jgi:hypothetical protein
MPKISKNRISRDGDYSTVELDEHLDTNCSYPENSELEQTKGKQKPTIINILALVFFHSVILKKTNTTFLNYLYRKEQINLTCEVNVMNFRKPNKRMECEII